MTPTRAEEDRRFLPLAARCAIGGLRGHVDLRVFDGRVHEGMLGIARKAALAPDEAAALARVLQQALDEIARDQTMAIRTLETRVRIASAKLRRLERRIALAPFPGLVRAILVTQQADLLEDAVVRINPLRDKPVLVSQPGVPVIHTYAIADLAAAAAFDPARLTACYESWRGPLLELLSQPSYVEFSERSARASAHDLLFASAELERLSGDLGVA